MNICIADIQVKTGNDCIYANMQEALRVSGSNLTEAALFFLCGGMNIPYLGDPKTFWFERMEQITTPFVQIQPQFSFHNTSQEYPVNLVNDCTDSLAQGYPVLLSVRTRCLSYHRAYTENAARGHIVTLYGLDVERNEAYVVDPHLRDKSGCIHTYQGPVALDELEKGCTCITFYRPTSDNRTTPNSVVTRAYMDHIASFLDWDRALESGGINAVRHVILDLAEWVTMSKKELQESCEEVYYGLRVGCILSHIEFIQMYAEEAGLVLRSGYHEAMSLLEPIYKEWKMFLLMLYKIGVQGRSERMKELSINGLKLLDSYAEALGVYLRWLGNQVER
ncbi:hypothetical protein GC096_08405 [Paenibacillus sp. LMG 31461]|uniref:Butirosin biosynthesis protein H N-terminal domain-containing protein n=1 Tax=Paenibacillus plantarum TaxID=2654975 RepID=A0ABX1X7J7_9BACL|nr:BtrH N-terminal domain-containing protein [Paenibacillus plantarum]NOU64043.1 hypothetical protein [Paenibacillus plantarum]